MLRVFTGCAVVFLTVNFVAGKDNTPPNLIAGRKVEAGAKLKKGDKLVGVWEKKNYLIEIVDFQSDKKLKVIWGGEPYNDIVPTDLYYIGDATPTRKKGTSPLPEAYRALDKNKDGQIGLYEWDRAKYAEFKKLDRNHDGFLTPHELVDRSTAAEEVVKVESPKIETDAKNSTTAADSKETETPENTDSNETSELANPDPAEQRNPE